MTAASSTLAQIRFTSLRASRCPINGEGRRMPAGTGEERSVSRRPKRSFARRLLCPPPRSGVSVGGSRASGRREQKRLCRRGSANLRMLSGQQPICNYHGIRGLLVSGLVSVSVRRRAYLAQLVAGLSVVQTLTHETFGAIHSSCDASPDIWSRHAVRAARVPPAASIGLVVRSSAENSSTFAIEAFRRRLFQLPLSAAPMCA